jgi:hypothetical protein
MTHHRGSPAGGRTVGGRISRFGSVVLTFAVLASVGGEATAQNTFTALGAPPSATRICPFTHPIKSNRPTGFGETCIYHVPTGIYYGRTKPDWCYASEEEALRDGCRRSSR